MYELHTVHDKIDSPIELENIFFNLYTIVFIHLPTFIVTSTGCQHWFYNNAQISRPIVKIKSGLPAVKSGNYRHQVLYSAHLTAGKSKTVSNFICIMGSVHYEIDGTGLLPVNDLRNWNTKLHKLCFTSSGLPTGYSACSYSIIIIKLSTVNFSPFFFGHWAVLDIVLACVRRRDAITNPCDTQRLYYIIFIELFSKCSENISVKKKKKKNQA